MTYPVRLAKAATPCQPDGAAFFIIVHERGTRGPAKGALSSVG